MSLALEQARLCLESGDVPVGAAVVRRGEIVAVGRNTREKDLNALCHAETEAIRAACEKLKGWRLWECDLYVTLEPCAMCAGAIVNARIKRVFFGAKDPKAGAFGGKFDINSLGLAHRPEVEGGLMEKEASGLLEDFFAALRGRTEK
ncbi:MAG: nucleoside deaminase [Clostridia bacterium]|nr:nucleoside deaminase [Clostridia bacterium]